MEKKPSDSQSLAEKALNTLSRLGGAIDILEESLDILGKLDRKRDPLEADLVSGMPIAVKNIRGIMKEMALISSEDGNAPEKNVRLAHVIEKAEIFIDGMRVGAVSGLAKGIADRHLHGKSRSSAVATARRRFDDAIAEAARSPGSAPKIATRLAPTLNKSVGHLERAIRRARREMSESVRQE